MIEINDSSFDFRTIIEEGIKKLGSENQTTIAIEELSELIKELTKYKRGKLNLNNMCEEIAHALLMIDNLIVLFDIDRKVSAEYMKAIDRLKELLK